MTPSPPAGVRVPGDAAGAATRRVLPQDVSFPPAPAPGGPDSGAALAARCPRDAPQQRQALLGRRGRGRGRRARGPSAPPGRPWAARRGPAARLYPLHPRARLPGVPAHPGAADVRERRAPAWSGSPCRGRQSAPAATRPARDRRARVTMGQAGAGTGPPQALAVPSPSPPPLTPRSEELDLCPGGRSPRFCFGFRVKSEARSGACLRLLSQRPEVADPALPHCGHRGAGTENSRGRDSGALPEAGSSLPGSPVRGLLGPPRRRSSPLWRRASGQMGVPWRPSPLLSFFGGETSKFL